MNKLNLKIFIYIILVCSIAVWAKEASIKILIDKKDLTSKNISIYDKAEFNLEISGLKKAEKCIWTVTGKDTRMTFSTVKNKPLSLFFNGTGSYSCAAQVRDSKGIKFVDTVTVRVTDHPPRITGVKDTSIRCFDSLKLDPAVADDGHIAGIMWDFNGDENWDWVSQKAEPVKHRFENPGKRNGTIIIKPVLSVFDDDGNCSRRVMDVRVEFKYPKADAGRSTIVCLHDSIVYNGWRSLAFFGEIDKWEWDFEGDGTIDTTCYSGEVKEITPSKPGNYRTYLWVTDEYGNRSNPDSITTIVVKDNPSAITDSGTTARVKQKVWFHGKGKKNCGGILEYRWDFNGDGKWDWKSAENEKRSVSFKKPGVYYAKFQVVGDDGLTGSSIFIVRITE